MKQKHLHIVLIIMLFLVVGFQPAVAIDIPINTTVGSWDNQTRTYTLTQHVSEGLDIVEDSLTLDGAGHTVTPVWPDEGVDFYQKSGITIKNLNVNGGGAGISLRFSDNCTISNNTVTLCVHGIWIAGSNDNLVTGNTTDQSLSSGIWLQQNASDNNITNNTTKNSMNGYGIYARDCTNNNNLTDNIITNNEYGIRLFNCSNFSSSITGNDVSNNTEYGIYLERSSKNTLRNNTVSNNLRGIRIRISSNDNHIYNNNIINNTLQASVTESTGNLFNLAAPTGGNYWTGWTSPDNNNDGFVDNLYVFGGGQDNLPLVRPFGSPPSTNRPPIADAGPDQTVEQTSVAGAEVILDGSASSDPDGDLLTYEWTWTNGSTSGVNPTMALPPGMTEVTLTVFDGELSDTDVVNVTVEDTIPPEIFIAAPEMYGLYAMGGLEFYFSAIDTIGVSKLWGTLTDSTGSSQEVCPGYVPGVGIYTLVVSASDEAGNDAVSEPVHFVVYDTEGGFVTGGGWIDSPTGAYKPDPSLAGKANFGFVSKYKNGTSIPTGNTEFAFKAGELNFHSSSYDWLVVTGSDYARFKGTGTINGSGEYRFMLWAGDDPDTFRIKIWWEEGEIENVIYDNGMDQGIGGGSIVVHTN